MGAVAVVIAVLVAGCGGGGEKAAPTKASGSPKPSEPLAAAAERLERVAPTGDCKQLAKLMLHSVRRGRRVAPSKPPTRAECTFIRQEARLDLDRFKVKKVR